MIIKYPKGKGFNTVIVAITVSVIVIAFTFNSTNFDKQKFRLKLIFNEKQNLETSQHFF